MIASKHFDRNGVLRFRSEISDEDCKTNYVYDANGDLVKVINYCKNLRHGTTEYYNEDGTMNYADIYRNGKQIGSFKYVLDGEIMKYQSTEFLDSENVKIVHGVYDVNTEIINFCYTIVITKEKLLKHDFSGVSTHYTRNIQDETHMYTKIDNKFQGDYDVYKNKTKVASMKYNNDVLHGNCWEFKNNHIYELCYEHGILEHIKISKDGKIKHVRNFKNKKPLGMQEDYHENGNIKTRYWINEKGAMTNLEEYTEFCVRIGFV